MFPSTSSRETLRLSGKQNSLFPSGADIKCIILLTLNRVCHCFLILSTIMSHVRSKTVFNRVNNGNQHSNKLLTFDSVENVDF